MSLSEVTDQTTYSFIFVVTPLEIISTKSIKNLKKSLLLKLGDKTQKTSQMNKPIQIPLQVMYSKTLKKYCPIKGIIKVYDINSDGSEVISSVGGFQTQQILNEQKTSTIIERDIGTSKVKMKIEIKNLGIVQHKHHKLEDQNKAQEIQSVFSKPKPRQNISYKSKTISQSIISTFKLSQQNVQEQNKKQKSGSQYFKRSTNLNGSPASQSPVLKKDINEKIEFRQPLSARVLMQKDNENKLKKDENKKFSNQQNSEQNYDLLKNQLAQLKKEKDEALTQFQKFGQCFESKSSKIWSDFIDKVKTLNWKYKSKQLQKVFDQLFTFILAQLEKNSNKSENLDNKIDTLAISLNEDITRRASENLSLKSMERQRLTLQIKLKQKQQRCSELQNRIKELQSFKKTLRQENEYLKEKDETMQQIISQKQTQIENLKQEMTDVQLQFKEMQAALKNDGCEIQELREQVSNLNETIETYREKYGDLKIVKNRALENQLKECLIWIDQQTRELEMSDFEQETQPSHSHNVSDIIKNIQLQGTSREQMNSIKEELAGLIKRIDNFLAK